MLPRVGTQGRLSSGLRADEGARSGVTVRQLPKRWVTPRDRGPTLIEDAYMLWTIAMVLLILWILGFFVVHVGGGLIHLLLVIAVIVIIYRLITGRPVA